MFLNLSTIQKLLNKFSYSAKVKIVISISSFLCIFALIDLVDLQEQFTDTLKVQIPVVKFSEAWTDFLSYLNDINRNKKAAHFSEYKSAFKIFHKEQKNLLQTVYNDSATMKLALESLNGSIYQLGLATVLKALPSETIENELLSLNNQVFNSLFSSNPVPNGTDIPTYILLQILFNKAAPADNLSLLSFALDPLNENSLPVEPGQILNSAEKLKLASKKELLTLQLTFQKEITQTLQTLLDAQIYTLEFREYSSLFFVAIGILIVLTVYSTRMMRTPLESLKFAAQQLAKGHLWQRAIVESQDEVGKMSQGFNTMVTLLEDAVSSTSVVSSKLIETISTIVKSAQKLRKKMSLTKTRLSLKLL